MVDGSEVSFTLPSKVAARGRMVRRNDRTMLGKYSPRTAHTTTLFWVRYVLCARWDFDNVIDNLPLRESTPRDNDVSAHTICSTDPLHAGGSR